MIHEAPRNITNKVFVFLRVVSRINWFPSPLSNEDITLQEREALTDSTEFVAGSILLERILHHPAARLMLRVA